MSYKLFMRFRNLGEDNVIIQHYTICDKKGFTWGGWWAKTTEALPLEGIKLLEDEIAQSGKVVLFLLDADKDRVHKADISELRYDISGSRIASPDKEYTPDYYSSSSCPLWFKMEKLQLSIDSKSLFDYAYADNQDFNVSTDTDFVTYDNIKVGSINELKQQRRTLILLRDKCSGDKELGFFRDDVSNFTNSFPVTNSNAILLFSDVHFSEEEQRFAFADCSNQKFYTVKSLSGAISDATENKEFAAAICAGDLTFKASTQEFSQAESFLFNISNTHSIDKRNIIFAPGNHDFMFLDNDETIVSETFPEAEKRYRELFEKFHGKPQKENKYFCVGRRFLLKNRLPIEVVVLNSNRLQQDEKHFKGMGFVGEDQLDFIAKKMKWDSEEGCNYAFRIMVLHHHLYPVDWSQEPEKNRMYSTCLDAGMILSFAAKYKIDLIIHGHKHRWNFIQTTGRTDEDLYTMSILGLGSTGSKDVSNTVGNSIGILDFSHAASVDIKIVALSANGPADNPIIFSRHLPINIAKC